MKGSGWSGDMTMLYTLLGMHASRLTVARVDGVRMSVVRLAIEWHQGEGFAHMAGQGRGFLLVFYPNTAGQARASPALHRWWAEAPQGAPRRDTCVGALRVCQGRLLGVAGSTWRTIQGWERTCWRGRRSSGSLLSRLEIRCCGQGGEGTVQAPRACTAPLLNEWVAAGHVAPPR